MKIGFQELLVVFIVALVVVGPDKLPYYAKKFGQAMAQFKKYTAEATKEIRENVVEPLQEAQKPLREAMEPFDEISREVKGSVNEVKVSFSDIAKPMKKSSSRENEMPGSTGAAEEKPENIPENPQNESAELKNDSASPEEPCQA